MKMECSECGAVMEVGKDVVSVLCSLCTCHVKGIAAPSMTTPKRADGSYPVPVGKVVDVAKPVEEEKPKRKRQKRESNPTYRVVIQKSSQKPKRGKKSIYGAMILSYLREHQTAEFNELLALYEQKKNGSGNGRQLMNFRALMYSMEKSGKVQVVA